MPGSLENYKIRGRQCCLHPLLIVVSVLLASCSTGSAAPTSTRVPTPEASREQATAALATPIPTVPSPTATRVEPATSLPLATPTIPSPTATQQPVSPLPSATWTASFTPQPATGRMLGLGLRRQTAPSIMMYQDQPGFVMSASVGLAEIYFPALEGWIRVLGAPSLETLGQKAEAARQRGVPYEGLAYGLETSNTTPRDEWQDLVGSTEKARAIADEYGKLLVMGPGFRLMSQNPDRYPEMAALSDMWVLQTQRLQLDPPGAAYRASVQRVVEQIRAGNADIAIWAQITLPPDREPNADEWLAYRQSIVDLVDGTFIGVYTWDTADEGRLVATIEEILAAAHESE